MEIIPEEVINNILAMVLLFVVGIISYNLFRKRKTKEEKRQYQSRKARNNAIAQSSDSKKSESLSTTSDVIYITTPLNSPNKDKVSHINSSYKSNNQNHDYQSNSDSYSSSSDGGGSSDGGSSISFD